LLASQRARVRHWKAGEVVETRRSHGLKVRPLVPEPAPDETMTIMSFAPGGALKGTPHLPGTREYFTCLDGRVSIGPANASILTPALCSAFPAICRTHIRISIDARLRAACPS
jgi:hypothetical protein